MTQVPEDNLIFHLPIIGSAEDNSDSELECTVTVADLTEDRLGNPESAFFFNGMTDYIEVEADPVWDLTFPFSISLWFQVEDYPADAVATLFKSDEDPGRYSGVWISLTSTGEIAAGYGNGEGIGEAYRLSKRTFESIETGMWHHVVAIFNDLGDIDIYIDCDLMEGDYSGYGTSMVNFGYHTAIGKYDWRMLNGKIDNIRVYKDAITVEESQYLCQEQPQDDANLISDLSTESDFALYPNPSNEFITIELPSQSLINQMERIDIFDFTGKKVLSFPITPDINSLTLNLRDTELATGTYFLKVIGTDQTIVYRNRFIFSH